MWNFMLIVDTDRSLFLVSIGEVLLIRWYVSLYFRLGIFIQVKLSYERLVKKTLYEYRNWLHIYIVLLNKKHKNIFKWK